jgi:hypothetical protein
LLETLSRQIRSGSALARKAINKSFSSGILVERRRVRRQLNPRVSTAIVDGNLRRWKERIGKRTNGNAHGLILIFLGVEYRGPANGAKPKYELGSAVADASEFGRGTGYLVWSGESGQRCENAAGPLLAGQAVANANSPWLTFDFNAQLSAGARGSSGKHWHPAG